VNFDPPNSAQVSVWASMCTMPIGASAAIALKMG
jgi:hypothetical protein